MKNILNHNGTSQLLLANVDDGTNRIVINGEELDPTYWVGEHTYVVLIDGTPIGIRQISSNSGNIMMRKVTDSVNEYQLVRQSDALCYSHIGQIIESTTLATLEDVQAIYGSDTTWIQHTGYILRGASSGVTADSAAKDGGVDAITPKGINSGGSVSNHTLTTSEIPNIQFRIPHVQYYDNCAIKNISESHTAMTWEGQARSINNNGWHNMSFGGGSGHNHGFTQPTFTGTEQTNMQSYKNVYIWERTK